MANDFYRIKKGLNLPNYATAGDLSSIANPELGDVAIVGGSAVYTYNGSSWVNTGSAGSVTSVNGQSGEVTLTSTNISEGDNLYFTDARAKAVAVVNSSLGNETDRAMSVSAAKSYTDLAVASESSARGSADATLQSNIDAEASSRASADTTLQSNIDAEASARAAADTVLEGKIRFLPENVRYVAKNGSDTEGNGSANAPFLTIQAALNSLSAPVAGDMPESAVYIYPGVYNEVLSWVRSNTHLIGLSAPLNSINGVTINGGVDYNITVVEPGGIFANRTSISNVIISSSGSRHAVNYTGSEQSILNITNTQIYQDVAGFSALYMNNTATAGLSRIILDRCVVQNVSASGHCVDLVKGDLFEANTVKFYRLGALNASDRVIKMSNNSVCSSLYNCNVSMSSSSNADYLIEMGGTGNCTISLSYIGTTIADKSAVYASAGTTFTAVQSTFSVPAGTGYIVAGAAGSIYAHSFNTILANGAIASTVFNYQLPVDTTTSVVAEGSNLYFTDARAQTAAVVNSTAGSETDQAASVSAMKAYVGSTIPVTSVNGETGAVVLDTGDVAEGINAPAGFSAGSNMLVNRSRFGYAGTRDAALAIQGFNGANLYTVERYDGSTWSSATGLSYSANYLAAAGTQDAAVSFGGYSSGYLVNSSLYNGSTWASTGNLNAARYQLAGAGIQNAALAIGGSVGSPVSTVEKFNGSVWSNNGAWALPTGRAVCAAAGLQDAALVIGGYITNYTSSVLQFNGSTWSAAASLLEVRALLGADGLQDAAMAVGGNDANGIYTSSTAIYNGSAWSTASSLLQARNSLGFAGTTSAAVAYGGENTAYRRTTETYSQGSSAGLYFTDARAQTASIVNSSAGSETTKAMSVSAAKSYTDSAVSAEASLRSSADTTLQGNIDSEASARAAADALLIPLTQKAAANGVATLDASSKIPVAQIPFDQSPVLSVNGETGIVSLDSGEVPEGSNLYFTDARAQTASIVNSSAGSETTKAMSVSAAKSYTNSAVSAEASLRSSADTTLQGNIDSEASTRASADTTLQNNINAEASARAAADALLIPLTQKAAAGGVATLDAGGKIPSSQLPPVAITSVTVVATIAERDALSPQEGDFCVVTDVNETYIYNGSAWIEIVETSGVSSVNGLSGVVSLSTTEISEGSNLYFTDARAQTAAVVNSSAGSETDKAMSVSAAKSYTDSAVSAEASLRSSADTTLQSNIDAEASTRASADTTLQGNIDAEASARSSADATLQGNIDAEVSARSSADATLQSNIDAEASTRASADTTLQSNIDAEASARAAADALLIPLTQKAAANGVATLDASSKIPVAQIPFDQSPVLSVNGETGIVSLDSGEVPEGSNLYFTDARAKTAAVVNSTAGSQTDQAPSVQAAKDFVNSLVSTEASSRASADTTLQSNIDAEASSRASADTTLQSNIDAEASARAAADALLIPLTQKGAANGVATLDGTGKIPSSQMPPVAITSVTVVATIIERDALSPQEGDFCVVTDVNETYIYNGSAWIELLETSGVTTVNGQTGSVSLSTTEISEGSNLYYTDTRAKTAAVVNSTAGSQTDQAPSVQAAKAYTDAAVSAEGSARQSADSTLQTNIDNEVTARTAADALLIPLTQKAATNGVATLDGAGKVPVAQIPFDQSPVTSVNGETGDVSLDSGEIPEGSNLYFTNVRAKTAAVVNSTAGNEIDQAASVSAMKTYVTDNVPVTSVNGEIGDIVLTSTNIAEGTNLYFTDARAKTAAVINSSAGSETDKAMSVSAAKSYTDSAVSSEASLRSSADATLQSNIDAEASSRASADTTLQSNIDAEASARAAADALLIPLTQKGAANGVATLDGTGKIPSSQMPPVAITSVTVVATIIERDALSPQEGDFCVVTDVNETYIYNGSGWIELLETSGVTTVNGQTGSVSLSTTEIGEGSNLYFTDARAKTAAVVNSSAGSETDQAMSVSASKSYTDSAVATEAAARASGDSLLIPLSQKGAANGVATLGNDGLVLASQLPASTAPVTSVNGEIGDVVLTTTEVTEGVSLYFTDTRARTAAVINSTAGSELNKAPSVASIKSYIATSSPVLSVNDQNGIVVLSTTDISEGVNQYFTNARARTAAVVNSTAGNETTQAASVAAIKSYIAANTISGVVRYGVSPMANGTDSFTVSFSDIGSTSYVVTATVSNTVDGSVRHLVPTVTAKASDSFTFVTAQTTDSANYVVNYYIIKL